jgi:hypothetical protein
LAVAVSTRLSAKQGRKFGFTLGIAFLVLAGLSFWRGHTIVPFILAVPGVLLTIAGLVAPTHLGPVERRWMAFGHWLSRFTSPVILGAIYFGVLMPSGLVMRLLGKNPMTAHHGDKTAWVTRGEKRKSDLNRQY